LDVFAPMKTPPFLIFVALLFWGWQSELLLVGAIAGALLEAARVFKFRWEFEDVDFNRIWSLCVLVVVGLFGYVFTTNGEGGGWERLVHGGAATAHNATVSSTMATTSVLRWLPLIFFPFIAGQIYNIRPSVPLTAVSLVLRWRRRRGERTFAGRYVDVSFSYFIVCVFSAGVHPNNSGYISTYFWGQTVLILWALWTLRSRRYGLKHWAMAFAVVIALGFLGQLGIGQVERMVQNFNAQWIARLWRSKTDAAQSVTSMGQIGELMLSPRIVIRLEPEKPGEAPDYLREASYRTYNANRQTWYVGGSVNDFVSVQPQPDNTTWLLLSNKVGAATVRIACYLNGRSLDENRDPQGVLPLPSGACRLLNLPYVSAVLQVQTNNTGAVLATGNGLQIFDARYGPGQTIDSSPDPSTNRFDLVVPTNEIPALDRVIAEMSFSGSVTNDAQIRQGVEAFFLRNFTYSTWQGPEKRGTNSTPLTRFLLNSRSGHCEYFASATVLLLRQMGIPARYAVGYYVHETSGAGYVVRERDAHAWCLAWDREKKQWMDFDTTPGSWVAIESRRVSLTEWLSDARSWLVFQFERLWWRQTNLRQYILWTLVPVMLVLLYYIIFQRRTKTRSPKKSATVETFVWPGHDSAFYQLEKVLAMRGLPREPGETLSDWLARSLAEPGLAGLRGPLRELLQLHYRYRFDPRGLSGGEKKSLVENVAGILETLAKES
jgi:protein-glutamine gamma-glutamyltransferase